MNRAADALHALAVTVWAGALWAVGLMVVPTLFDALPDHAIAGPLSARLSLYVSVLGLACAAYLLLMRLARFGGHALRQAFFWVVVLLALLTVLGQFGVHSLLAAAKGQPMVHDVIAGVLRDRTSAWYGVASVLYLVECVLAGAMVLLQQSAPR
jgi:uncharacterized membrane protein YhaH (DUF805 family)